MTTRSRRRLPQPSCCAVNLPRALQTPVLAPWRVSASMGRAPLREHAGQECQLRPAGSWGDRGSWRSANTQRCWEYSTLPAQISCVRFWQPCRQRLYGGGGSGRRAQPWSPCPHEVTAEGAKALRSCWPPVPSAPRCWLCWAPCGVRSAPPAAPITFIVVSTPLRSVPPSVLALASPQPHCFGRTQESFAVPFPLQELTRETLCCSHLSVGPSELGTVRP